MNVSSPLEPDRDRRAWLGAVLIALLTFLAIAPTLRRPQLTGGNENIVVATSLQMRQGGPWLVPQLNGEPRIKKPPLVAWITAVTLRQSTIDQLDSPEAIVRSAAYVDLAWQVRWTGVAAGGVLILATFAFARTIGGNTVGLGAAMIVATNLLFMKFMRQSTTDVHLAMWVTIANACFAMALLERHFWLAATLGAFATGMAFLCKGPVALLETILPLVAGAMLLRRTGGSDSTGLGVKRCALLIGTGAAVFALVALPWFAHVLATVPGAWATWFTEVTREGATDLEPSSPGIYLLLGPMMWPWLVFGVIGLILICKHPRDARRLLPLLQVLLPLAVMICFRDRKDRYLLPMIAPSATICAIGLAAWVNDWKQRNTARLGREQAVLGTHVFVLLGGAIALAWVGVSQPTVDGRSWWPASVAGMMSLLLLLIASTGVVLQRRHPWATAGATFATVLLLQAIFIVGYARGPSGMSAYAALADTIRTTASDARVYEWGGKGQRLTEEMSIYLNRAIFHAEPGTLRAAPEGATVVLLRQYRGEPDPLLPAPWRLLGTATEKKQTWWAYLLPPDKP